MSAQPLTLRYLANILSRQKRLNAQKRKRDKERKELEALNRRHFANVRIVQRNLVYVTGLGSRFAKEEVDHMLFLCA